MKPIALTDSEGTIYAYACGACHQVANAGERIGRLDGPDPVLVRDSLDDARECCRCRTCGGETDREVWCRPCADRMTEERIKLDTATGIERRYCRHGEYPGDCIDCATAAAARWKALAKRWYQRIVLPLSGAKVRR